MIETGVTRRHRPEFITRHNARRTEQQVEAEPAPTPSRTPRLTRLMALAIRFEHLLGTGVVEDQAQLAELGHVSRPRVTQIMNLLHLSPDIQEAILSLPAVVKGYDPLTERHVRHIAAEPDWDAQREQWRRLAAEIAQLHAP